MNVFHFAATAAAEGGFTGDASRITWSTDLATDWRTNVRASFLACHTQDYTLNEIRSQVLEVPGQFEHRLSAVSDTTGAPAVGTIGAVNSDDLTSAVVIKWRTNVASRRTRGRTYIGPLEQGSTDLGKMVAGGALATNLATFITAMARYQGAGAGVAAGFQRVIYSRPYSAPDGAYVIRGPSGLTVVNNTTDYDGQTSQVTLGSVDTTLRVQRRREVGVGS